MGMTIEEIIQGIQVIKAQAEWDYPLDWQIVLDGAIETMRKYKQIVQIYQKWNEVNDFSYNQAIRKIGEVLEDGRNLPSLTPQLSSGLEKNSKKLEKDFGELE